MSERVVEYLTKEYCMQEDEARKLTSEIFNYLSSKEKEQKSSAEEKATIAIGILKAGPLIGKAIKTMLDNC